MSDGNERVPIYGVSESAFAELIFADISLSSDLSFSLSSPVIIQPSL